MPLELSWSLFILIIDGFLLGIGWYLAQVLISLIKRG
jgi:hypothetical protein